MLWTDEAVETLKRLAVEGLSAARIAAELGASTRNAVIGKANRIGIKLNGDGRASAPASPTAAARGRRLAPAALPNEVGKPAWTFANAEVGEMRRVGLQDILRLTCRWPIGDPTQGDFAYCGLTAAEGRPYCAGHCRMAYRPPNLRARRSPHERQSIRAAASW
jgi:GcrA cell cycle regulator